MTERNVGFLQRKFLVGNSSMTWEWGVFDIIIIIYSNSTICLIKRHLYHIFGIDTNKQTNIVYTQKKTRNSYTLCNRLFRKTCFKDVCKPCIVCENEHFSKHLYISDFKTFVHIDFKTSVYIWYCNPLQIKAVYCLLQNTSAQSCSILSRYCKPNQDSLHFVVCILGMRV